MDKDSHKIWNRLRNISSLKDLSAIGIANIGGGALAGFFWFYIASIMTPDEYGQIGYLTAIGGIASVICQFGTGYFTVVYTAKKQNTFPVIALISISSSLVAAIVLYILFKEPSLGIFAIGYLLFNLAISDLFGRKAYTKYAIILLTQKILLLVLGLSMYYFIGPMGIIYGWGFSMFVFSYHIFSILRKAKIEFSILKEKIGFALNTYFESVAKSFSNESDKFVIAPLLGFTLLGNFHLALQVLSVLSIVPGIISQYIIPEEASGNSKNLLKKYYVILSIILAMVGIFVAPILITKFFPKYIDTLEIVPIISIAIIPSTVNSIFYSKFLAREKSKFIIISSLTFMIIEIPMIVLLGKSNGIFGVASAYLIAMTIQTCVSGIIYKKFLK